MARVTLTTAEILTGLHEDGYRLGNGQYSYSIPTAGSTWPTYAAATEPFSGYAALNATQAANFRAALATWDELILPNFTEVAETATARGEVRIAFTRYEMDQGTAGYAYQSVPQSAGGKVGDVWLNADTSSASFARGTEEFDTMVHEIGHTLGLKHSFDPPAIPSPYENRRYTVESYNTATASEIVTFALRGSTIVATFVNAPAATPMVLDIAAVQSIYGADPTTRSGNSTYSFNQDDRFFQSIYDAGGIDTIDLSNFTRSNTVDLTPGAYSSIGEWGLDAQIAYWTALYPAYSTFIRNTLSASDLFVNGDNVGIALSTTIENATGGAAADRITGNAAANVLRGLGGADTISGGDGDDRIEGGSGNDVLTGGAGADVFVFGTNDGADRITDFALAQDQFDLGGRLFTSIADTAAGAVLTHSGGTVQLDGLRGLSLLQVNARVLGQAETPTPTPTPTLPTVGTILATWPADGATGIAITAPIRIVFPATLTRGTGNLVLARADGTVVETITAASGGVTLSGAILTIDPTRPLEPGTGYTLRIDAGAVLVGGTPFAGLTGFDFTTSAAAPVAPADRYDLLVPTGAGATATGSGDVFGTAGAQWVTIADQAARVVLDASFNRGGDTVVVAGAASGWTVARSGSAVVLSDGDTSVVLPVGLVGADVRFDDGIRTVRLNAGATAALIGDQVVTTAATQVSALPGGATATGTIDTTVASQLLLSSGATATATGTQQVFGTAGAETVFARGTSVSFDPSFNGGGDVLVLNGRAVDYTATRSGSTVVLTGGAQSVTIPVGLTGATLRFADGDRTLAFDPAAGIKVGAQVVATTGTILTPALTTTATVERDDDGSLLTPFTIDASGGNLRFVDDPATAQNVRLIGFGRGDALVLSGSASEYLFANSGSDVMVQRVGADGVLSTTTLVGVGDPSVVVTSEATAELAVGFDFATFTI